MKGFEREGLDMQNCTAERMTRQQQGTWDNTLPSMRAALDSRADIIELISIRREVAVPRLAPKPLSRCFTVVRLFTRGCDVGWIVGDWPFGQLVPNHPPHPSIASNPPCIVSYPLLGRRQPVRGGPAPPFRMG